MNTLLGLCTILVMFGKDSASVEFAIRSANEKLERGSLEEACELAELAVALEPLNPEALALRARSRMSFGCAFDALEDLKKAAARTEDNKVLSKITCLQGNAYRQISEEFPGDSSKENRLLAIQAFDRALQYDPSNIEAASDRLLCAIQWKEDLKSLEARLIPPSVSAKFLAGIAQAYLDRGMNEEGIQWAQKAVEKEPENSFCLFIRGRAYGQKAMNAGILEGAKYAGKIKTDFQSAVDYDPSHWMAQFALMEFYLNAPWIVGGSLDKAKEVAEQIARLDEERGLQAKIRILQFTKEWEKAREVFKQLRQLSPRNASVDLQEFFFEFQGPKDFKKAREVLYRWAQEDVAAAGPVYWLARLDFEEKEWQKAADGFQRYIHFMKRPGEPSEGAALWRLGLCFEKMENLPQAIEALKKSIATPHIANANAQKDLDRLESK